MLLAIAQRFDRDALLRMVAAGGAWGLTLAAGFFAIAWMQCGAPCPDDVIVTAATCVATGIVTIGPLAAIARPS